MGDYNSRIADDVIIQWMMNNPCELLESGNIRLPPARLSFPYLFEKQAPMEPEGTSKYSATFLFHPFADLTVAKNEAARIAKEKWSGAFQKGGPTLHSPFRDQADKLQFDGYVEGGIFITASGERKVPVVDRKMIPIVEPEKVYPGVWVIGTVRPFVFEKKAKKGVSFGLQSIMVVADDNQLGGGGSDPNQDFKGVQGFEMDRDAATGF